MADIFPFVALEFAHAIGPAPGRYLVAPEGSSTPVGDPHDTSRRFGTAPSPNDDVLQIRVIGAPPPRGGVILRRPRRAHAGDPPRETSVIVATLIGSANRFRSLREAGNFVAEARKSEELQETLIEDAVEAVNSAIRAYRSSARDPYVGEIAAIDAREIRIGYGTGLQLSEGQFEDAFVPPPPARSRVSREERLKPDEAVAAHLQRRLPLLDAEDLFLRTVLDLERGRGRSAAVQLRACIDLLVGELTDAGESFIPPRDHLLERSAAVERLAQLALDNRLDDDALGELEEHLDRVEDALEDWRAFHTDTAEVTFLAADAE